MHVISVRNYFKTFCFYFLTFQNEKKKKQKKSEKVEKYKPKSEKKRNKKALEIRNNFCFDTINMEGC